jgi:hypothetical protein
MTYATLQADVAAYIHRDDLGTLMPTFIRRAEAFLFRELNVKALAISVAGTTTGEYATLPSDFQSVSKVTVNYGSAEYALDYKSESVIASTSVPTSYALENNQLRINGAGTGQAYVLYYIPKISALSNSNTTNWLLDNAEDLYLYATARECAKHIRDTEQVAQLDGYITPLLDSVRRLSERKGQPANGSMQIKVRT